MLDIAETYPTSDNSFSVNTTNVGIYRITSPSGKVYVGQSWGINKRKGQYSRLSCETQTKLHSSIKHHSWAAHTFEVIMSLPPNTDQQLMDYWEQFFMDYYKSDGCELMNLREATSRGKHSESTKQAISNSLKKSIRSQETRDKISATLKELYKDKTKVPFYGRHHTPEAKLKLSLVNRGKAYKTPSSEELYRRALPVEDRKEIGINKHRVPVLQYTKEGEFVKEWRSIKDAQDALSIHGISRNLKGGRPSAGGFIWKYKN